MKEKILSIKKKWVDKKINFINDISTSFGNLNKISGVFIYKKVIIFIN